MLRDTPDEKGLKRKLEALSFGRGTRNAMRRVVATGKRHRRSCRSLPHRNSSSCANKLTTTAIEQLDTQPDGPNCLCVTASPPERLQPVTRGHPQWPKSVDVKSATNQQTAMHVGLQIPTSRNQGRPGYRGRASWADDSAYGDCCEKDGLLPG